MIFVHTINRVEGFHRYDNAPESVRFLRHDHRHIFEIVCDFQVTDADREIELFIRQAEIAKLLADRYGTPCRFEGRSCEMIALELIEEFECVKCTVLEDGMGGAIAWK